MAPQAITVLERHVKLYQRLWRASAFSFFILPILFLVSMGWGVGQFVHTIDGHDYLKWIAPGLLASTAFQIGANESTYGVLSEFKWVGGIHAMRSTPVRIPDMVLGWLLYVLIVTEVATGAFLIVAWAFGALTPGLVISAPLVSGLVSVAVAAPTTAFSAAIDDMDWFLLLSRFLILPAVLFSGVLFPVSQLPGFLQPLAYFSPLTHAVALLRDFTFGHPPLLASVGNVAYLLIWLAVGWWLANLSFRRRLED
ncbi:ABC transporter permease [Nocardia sp. NPDC051570]|uniref:ABC transporter permease n=1 Tax=Nocardia sp. NPDC051570 TaxID=3364324 RepID=UPI0037A593A9